MVQGSQVCEVTLHLFQCIVFWTDKAKENILASDDAINYKFDIVLCFRRSWIY